MALPSALLVALSVHSAALRTFFAQDDLVFLARAAGLEASPTTLWRVLSATPRWRLFYAWFGMDPLPYHLANLSFHLLNVTLVYATARRLFGGRGTAWAAAVLFGTSAIAFTPVHWATGFTEILATTFALAALWLYLAARGAGPGEPRRPRERPALLWISAAAVLAAGLSKEATLLLPLALVAADRRLGTFAPRARTLVPGGIAGLLFVIGYASTFRSPEHLGGEAYALTMAPAFVAQNLATYLAWSAAFWVPVRDAVASADPRAAVPGALVALAAVLILASQRRARRHPEELSAVWFLALLAPVVPLAHHTYLYYLYLPWAGACWFLAGAGERLARRWPVMAPLLLAAALAFAGVQAWSVRARQTALTGIFLADRTVRESTMLRNVIAALDSSGLAPGAHVAFVNPAPERHSSLAGAQAGPRVGYLPLEAALRGGEVLRLRFPDLGYLGFSDTLPRTWEDAEVFLFQDDGRSRHLGHGARALAELGYFTLRTRQFARADAMFTRSLALGDTLPDAVFGLVTTADLLGRTNESRQRALEFLRRWPRDPRAPVLTRALGLERQQPLP